MQTFSIRAVTTVAGLFMLGGCTSTPPRVANYKLPFPPQGIVLVVEGSGGSAEASKALSAAVDQANLPLHVRSFDWTHGRTLGIADVTDLDHSRAEAGRLAALVPRYQRAFPETPIYIVAFSAGAQVALEANKYLEPNGLERIVLLAPAVSAEYDLRKSLTVARQGVDAFTSERDFLYLGLGTGLLGTADGRLSADAAGRVGFDMPLMTGADLHLANRLHQHPWDSSVSWTGNTGRHSGSLRPAFLRAYVLPLLSAPATR